jgi:magnesium-protoporphyrin O-methyltransferase
MKPCCDPIDGYFDERYARAELRRYRRGRLDAPTRRLLRAVRAEAPAGATVIDIGGGVGLVTHELMRESAGRGTYIDGSSAHVRAAREEAERQGHAGRVRFIHGDFLDMAGDVEPADVVVMHRVVCCYPDAERLLAAAAGRARRVLALSYPHDVWPIRAEIAFGNWIRGRRPVPFRAFVHPQRVIDSTLADAGLLRRTRDGTPYWRIEVYARHPA